MAAPSPRAMTWARRWLPATLGVLIVAVAGASPADVAFKHFLQHGGLVQLEAVQEDGEGAAQELAENSMKIVGSMVQAFLNKQAMTKEDRQCLVKGSEDFTHNIMQVAQHIVMLIQEITGKRSTADMPDISLESSTGLASGASGEAAEVLPEALQTSAAPVPASTASPAETSLPHLTVAQALSVVTQEQDPSLGRRLTDLFGDSSILMHLAAVFTELGTSIQLLVKLSRHIANNCVEGDALEALEAAGRHVRDFKYVSGHFMANGADCLTELAHAAIAYKGNNFEDFGTDMGIALRKILLSEAKGGLVAEGRPGKQMMVNMSMGFVKGFFGKGFTLGVKLDRDPDEPLRIDLESCIANNLPFFEQVFSTAMYAYQKSQMNKSPDQQAELSATRFGATGSSMEGDNAGRVEFGTALAVAAMELPDALSRCGIGSQQGDMLIDSVKAFGAGMHLAVQTPNKVASNSEMTENLGQSINDWKKLDWYAFGFDLGLLLQELVLDLFPNKYSVDSLEGLHQQLSDLRGKPGGLLRQRALDVLLVWTLPACAALGAVAALVAVRRGRARRRPLLWVEEAASTQGSEMESGLE